MCNAWNHWSGCTCGFGGDTGGAGGIAVYRGWTLFDDPKEPVTRPTTCWMCGAEVYFYRNENGGCALFDELGRPWQVHECWELHRSQRSRALEHINNVLGLRKYDGSIDPDEYEEVDPPEGTTNLRTLNGVVAENPASRMFYSAITVGPVPSGAGRWVEVKVLCRDLVYPVLVPEHIACLIPENVPLEVCARWIRHPDGTNLFAYTVTRHNINGTLRLHRQSSRIEAGLKCEYCDRRINTNEDWGFDQKYSLECHRCANLRRGLQPSSFISDLKRIVCTKGV